MTRLLERFTTEYIEVEDRIRLTGACADQKVSVFWLNLRLAQRLVPVLLNWLSSQQAIDQQHTDLLNSFAQQAARAAHTPQPPVEAQTSDAAHLIHAISVSFHPEALELTLGVEAAEHHARIQFGTAPLRQWVNILYDLYRKAEWPLDQWPDWIKEPEAPEPPAIGRSVVLH